MDTFGCEGVSQSLVFSNNGLCKDRCCGLGFICGRLASIMSVSGSIVLEKSDAMEEREDVEEWSAG
jgi:hypothetical protein